MDRLPLFRMLAGIECSCGLWSLPFRKGFLLCSAIIPFSASSKMTLTSSHDVNTTVPLHLRHCIPRLLSDKQLVISTDLACKLGDVPVCALQTFRLDQLS